MSTNAWKLGWVLGAISTLGCAVAPEDQTATSHEALMSTDETGAGGGGGDDSSYVDPAQVTSIAETAVQTHFSDPDQQQIALEAVDGLIDTSQFELMEGPTYTGCVSQYLSWCTASNCQYPDPATVSCLARNAWSLSCAPRSAAYCIVRCIYNNCTYNSGY